MTVESVKSRMAQVYKTNPLGEKPPQGCSLNGFCLNKGMCADAVYIRKELEYLIAGQGSRNSVNSTISQSRCRSNQVNVMIKIAGEVMRGEHDK